MAMLQGQMIRYQKKLVRRGVFRFCSQAESEPEEKKSNHSWRGRNRPLKSKLKDSASGILRLQGKFGKDFQFVDHVEQKEKTGSSSSLKWRDKRELKYVKDVLDGQERDEKLKKLDDTATDLSKIPFERVQSREYNWNPYQDHNKDKPDVNEHLSQVSDSYRQGGWGMQAHPRWNSRYWKIWPSTRVAKRAVESGRNIAAASSIYNPLEEGGQRHDPLLGNNYIDIHHPNSAVLNIPEHDSKTVTDRLAAERFIKEQMEAEEDLLRSLPPYKSGFEDVPVKFHQRDFWFPGYDEDTQRRRELKVRASLLIKHVRPALTGEQIEALDELMKKSNIKYKHHTYSRFNKKTGEIFLFCEDCHTRPENERRVLKWFTRLIAEARRLGDSPESASWDEYNAKWGDIWEEEDAVEKRKKASWILRKAHLPDFMRKNSNLYLSGKRMLKSVRYADRMHAKMNDTGLILQREGPTKGNGMSFWKEQIPINMDQFRSDVDHLPADPDNYPQWLNLWKDIYNKDITLDKNSKKVEIENRVYEGKYLICPAEKTRLGKEKARRAIHNWRINVQRHRDTKVNRPEYASLHPYWQVHDRTLENGEIQKQVGQQINKSGEVSENKTPYPEKSKHWWDHPMWSLRSTAKIPVLQDTGNPETDDYQQRLYPPATPHMAKCMMMTKILPATAYPNFDKKIIMDWEPIAPVFKNYLLPMPPKTSKGARRAPGAQAPSKDAVEKALQSREKEKKMLAESLFFTQISTEVAKQDEILK